MVSNPCSSLPGLDHANPHAEKHDQQRRQHRQTDAFATHASTASHIGTLTKVRPRALDNEPAAENQALRSL